MRAHTQLHAATCKTLGELLTACAEHVDEEPGAIVHPAAVGMPTETLDLLPYPSTVTATAAAAAASSSGGASAAASATAGRRLAQA